MPRRSRRGRRRPADRPRRPGCAVAARTWSWPRRAAGTRRPSRPCLRRDVAYVGLVASPTRARPCASTCATSGVPEERLAALRAPAGLDLGAETPAEIAHLDPGRAGPGPPRPRPVRGRARPRRAAAGRAQAAVAPALEAERRRRRGPGLWHDRRVATARHIAQHEGDDLLLLQRRLPGALRARSGVIPRRHRLIAELQQVTGGRMQFAGTVDIAAPRAKVWAFLMDPAAGRQLRTGRGERRGRSTTTHFKARPRSAWASSRRASWSTMEMADLHAARRGHHQGPRPGARQRGRRHRDA